MCKRWSFKMFIRFFFILLILHTPCAEIILDDITEKDIALSDCLVLVTKRYISAKTNTLVVKENYSNYKNANYRLKERVLQDYNSTIAIQLGLGESSWNFYVFIVDGYAAFKELHIHIPDFRHELELYFLIILTHTVEDYQLRRHIKLQIFRRCVHLRVLNVVIMEQMYNQSGLIEFYTYSFYADKSYANINILQINYFQNGILEKDQLFPQQLMNFKGCTLNITICVFMPWVGFNGDPENVSHKRDVNRLTGIDGIQLKLLAQILNFTVNLNFTHQKGKINLKENSAGGFAELETFRTDLAVGGLSITYENRSKFSTSTAYRYTPYLFVVRSDLQFGPLKQLANPFEPEVWLAIGITILLALVIITTISHSACMAYCALILDTQHQFPNTNLFTILLGNPITKIPRCNLARFLLMSWLFFTLILRNAYQGKLYDSLRVSRRIAIPRSVSELIRSDYKLLSTTYVDYYPENLTIIMKNVVQQLYEVQNSEKRLTVVTTLETLGYFNFMHRNTSRLSYVPEAIYSLYLTIYFQKHSILKPVFDKRIRELLYSGITNHLTTRQFGRPEFQMMNVGNFKVLRIDNKMLQGLYGIYGILIGISILFFILEILTVNVRKLKNLFDQLHNQS